MFSCLLLDVLDLASTLSLLMLVSGAWSSYCKHRYPIVIDLEIAIMDLPANVFLDLFMGVKAADDLVEVKLEIFLLKPGRAMYQNTVEDVRSELETTNLTIMMEESLLTSLHHIAGLPSEGVC